MNEDADARIYPCADCGKMRSKNEGGTVFTVCDECWDRHYAEVKAEREQRAHSAGAGEPK
jgi:hypothetical protein